MDFTLFESRPGLSIVFLPDAPKLSVAAISNDLLRRANLDRKTLTGKSISEIFAIPSLNKLTDIKVAQSSIEEVIALKKRKQFQFNSGENESGNDFFY